MPDVPSLKQDFEEPGGRHRNLERIMLVHVQLAGVAGCAVSPEFVVLPEPRNPVDSDAAVSIISTEMAGFHRYACCQVAS